MKYSEIKIKVGLDQNKVPQDIKWKASDSLNSELSDCKAFNLSIWDPVESDSLSINLWTENMQTDEMHTFYFKSLIQLTESYQKATQNPIIKSMMTEFVNNVIKATSDWENNK